MESENTPRRRRGLPRTEGAESEPASEPAETTPQTPPEVTPEVSHQASPEPPAEAAEPVEETPSSTEQPARRAGMGEQSRRTGMGGQPARRTGMGAEPTQQPEQPRRRGMAAQPAQQPDQQAPKQQGPEQQTPNQQEPEKPRRRMSMGEEPQQQPSRTPSPEPVQEKPSPTPAEAKTGAGQYTGPKPAAPKPTKTQPAQKTFLNRTGKQWALIGPVSLGIIIVVAAAAVLVSRWLLGTEPVADFVERYPGQYPQPDAPGGYPAWLNWAHFFNAFLMVLIIKTGIQIRTEARPAAYWTPKWNRKRKISLTIWLHNGLDLLWVLNGAAFVLLLLITGYWQRVVPTSWEIFPNALSAGLQYASLDWPTSVDWAHYNSLQELAYFTTIFIAAPLAILTGVRMSGLWPAKNGRLNTLVPVELARAVHFPVMIYFTAFILVHLFLVLATDALRNLNQIYTGDDAQNWTGFWLFALSVAVIVAGAFLARALFVAPIASLFGRVGR